MIYLELLDSIVFMSQNRDITKIEAVKMVIRALGLQKEHYRKRWQREEIRREMMVYIDKAKQFQSAGDFEKARDRFLTAVSFFERMDREGYFHEDFSRVKAELEEFTKNDPEYLAFSDGDLFDEIISLVVANPGGLTPAEIAIALFGSPENVHINVLFFLKTLVILGKIRKEPGGEGRTGYYYCFASPMGE